MTRIFISYSRNDAEFAGRLAADLQQHGADVWLDSNNIRAGTKWSTAIQQALDAANVMILVLSPSAMASTNVEDEWQYFLDHKKSVIPVLLTPTEVHFQLKRIQYIDFHKLQYGQAFAQLQAELRRYSVPLRAPIAPALAASASPVSAQSVSSGTPIRADHQSSPRPRKGLSRRTLLIVAMVGVIGVGSYFYTWFTSKPDVTLTGHQDSVQSIAISADSKYVLSGGRSDRTAILWDAATGNQIRKFPVIDADRGNMVTAVNFSPDGNNVLTGHLNGTIRIWDRETGTEIRNLSARGEVKYLGYAINSPDLVAQSLDGSFTRTITRWNTSTWQQRDQYAVRNADGSLLYTVGRLQHFIFVKDADQTVQVLDAYTRQVLHTYTFSRIGITNLAISSDLKSFIALDLSDRTIPTLWSMDSGLAIRTFSGHSDSVFSFATGHSQQLGNIALTGSDDRSVKLWDLDTGENLRTFANYAPESGHLETTIAIAPDGSFVALISGQNILIWRL